MKRNLIHNGWSLLTAVAVMFAIRLAPAQEITGTPGSPSATTTIDGKYLPVPPQPFGGEINPNALQSKPYWPARVVPRRRRARPTCC